MNNKKISILIGCLLSTTFSYSTPLQLSVPGYNLPKGDVNGVRLNLFYGETHSVKGVNLHLLGLSKVDNFKGLDIGLLSMGQTNKEFSGVSLSLVAHQKGNTEGLNIGALNIVNNMKGVNLGIINYSSTFKPEVVEESVIEQGIYYSGLSTAISIEGMTTIEVEKAHDYIVNLGLANINKRDVKFNLGALNYTDGKSVIDLGLINYSETTTFQLGLINATNSLDGVQIGLVNYAKNGVVPVLPLVNFRVSVD